MLVFRFRRYWAFMGGWIVFFCCCKSCWPSEFRMEARVVKERRGRNSVYMLVRYHESGCVNAFDPQSTLPGVLRNSRKSDRKYAGVS